VGDRNKAKGSGSSTYVYVSNLKFQLNEQDILDFFKSKGLDAIRARLLYDDEGNSKGTAFVEMNSLEKAEDAVAKLHNVQYQGRSLIVNIANKNSSH
jgi:RNA recognition motif-containing protein